MKLQMGSQKSSIGQIGELFLQFTLSRCSLLICQIFTHDQFYCPLWAIVGKIVAEQFIPVHFGKEAIDSGFGQKTTAWSSSGKKPVATGSRQKHSLYDRLCYDTKF